MKKIKMQRIMLYFQSGANLKKSLDKPQKKWHNIIKTMKKTVAGRRYCIIKRESAVAGSIFIMQRFSLRKPLWSRVLKEQSIKHSRLSLALKEF